MLFRISNRPVNWLYSQLDKRAVQDLAIERSQELEYKARRPKDEDFISHALTEMAIIDAKSSALLTHVSVMIAATVGLMVFAEGEPLLQGLLAFELLVYVIVAAVLLRCVDVMGPPLRLPSAHKTELNRQYQREVLIRRGVYQSTARIVFALTIGLVAIIVLKYLSGFVSWYFAVPPDLGGAPRF